MWNGEPQYCLPLLEELAVNSLRHSPLQWVLVDDATVPRLRLSVWEKDSHYPNQRIFKQTVLGRVPFLTRLEFTSLVRQVAKKGYQEKIKDMCFLLVADERYLAAFKAVPLKLLCFVKPDASTTSFLYNLIKTARQQQVSDLEMFVVIRGTEKIEEAADLYHGIEKEIASLITGKPVLRFSGFLNPREDKILIAGQSGNMLLTDLFPGDAFHGQLKYVLKKLEKLFQETTNNGEAELLGLIKRLEVI
jgi:hypothetical protein